MKKEKHTAPPKIEDTDPIDGVKAIGCLFAGIVILAIFLSLSGWFIHSLR